MSLSWLARNPNEGVECPITANDLQPPLKMTETIPLVSSYSSWKPNNSICITSDQAWYLTKLGKRGQYRTVPILNSTEQLWPYTSALSKGPQASCSCLPR